MILQHYKQTRDKIYSNHQRVLLVLLALTFPFFSLAQNMGGIGAQLLLDTVKDGYTLPRIKSVIPNSPAAAAGIPEGGYIIMVNELPCKNKTLEDVVKDIRGEAGTKVNISVSDNPEGKKAKDFSIIRAEIKQVPPAAAPDPAAIFSQEYENEVKKIKKQGFTIVKTFNSECGNFYFNFEADEHPNHVKVLTMEARAPGTNTKAFEAAADLFDNSNESVTTKLKANPSHESLNSVIGELEGSMTFKHNSIGVVNTQITAISDAKKCLAMYVIIYK
jgi:membrane-associated protease RseP (regulator of RpoE activity)